MRRFSSFQLNLMFILIFILQVIWVCILCRKKQELLSKTGQWINKNAGPDGFPQEALVSFQTYFHIYFLND